MDEEEIAEALEREAREEAGKLPEKPVDSPKTASPRDAKPKGVPAFLTIGAVVLLLGGAVGLLLFGTDASDAFVYSKLVDEVMSSPDEFLDRELRVEGDLRQGSVVFTSDPECEHRFVLTRGEYEMPVSFPRCVVPDTFRDDMGITVVVQGQLQPDGTFLANQVIPRCPSKYEMQQREQDGEEAPHAMPPTASAERS